MNHALGTLFLSLPRVTKMVVKGCIICLQLFIPAKLWPGFPFDGIYLTVLLALGLAMCFSLANGIWMEVLMPVLNRDFQWAYVV